MLLKRLLAVLCIGCTTITSMAFADEKSFDQAVDIYMKGFKECVDAHAVRGDNISTAKRKYTTYLRYKEQAAAIDQSILTSPQRSLQKNQRYCEKAYENILIAEAEPIIKKGITACEQAKTAYETGKLEEAKIKIDLFDQQNTEALSITDKILDIYAIASKVRSCNRIKKKISTAEKGFQIQEEESQLAIIQLIDANDQCSSAQTLANKPNVKLSDIDAIQKALNKSRAQTKATKNYTAAITAMKNYPDRDSSKQMVLLFDKAASCAQSVSARLTKTRSKKTSAEKSINDAAAIAKQAYDKCQAGESLVKGKLSQYKNLDEALKYHNDAKKLRLASQKKPGASLATQYSQWESSKKYQRLINKSKACEKKVIALHKSRKTEYGQRKNKQLQEEAAARRKQLEDKRKKDEENTKRLEEERVANLKAEAEAVADAEAQKISSQKKPKSRSKKSWSDLISDDDDDIGSPFEEDEDE